MNFTFTIEDFLNYFGSGFVLLFGIMLTNYEGMLQVIPLLNDMTIWSSLSFVILAYIIGLTLSAVTNFLEQDFYLFIDNLIRKTYKKERKSFKDKMIHCLVNWPLNKLKLITLFLFFRKWASIETQMYIRTKFKTLEEKKNEASVRYEELLAVYEKRESNADEKSLKKELKKLKAKKDISSAKYNEYCRRHEGLQILRQKSIEEIYTIEKMLKKDNKKFGYLYWYTSQFWQISSNAVLAIFLINIFYFKSVSVYTLYAINLPRLEYIPFLSISAIVYLMIFFLGKCMSPMYIKMYIRQLSREYKALEDNAK
jgi:hypothetical protein